jgi:hypothetical protein
MKPLAYNLLVGVTAIAMVETIGIGGWRLLLVCLLLLAVWFRPRGDAVARRERRIERESDKVARMIADTRDVLSRAIDKLPPPDPQDRPPDLVLRDRSDVARSYFLIR